MNEEQLNEAFDVLLAAMQNRPPAQPEAPKPVEPPTVTREQLKELMDPSSDKYDPEAALNHFVQKNYGTLISDISERANTGVMLKLRQEFDDFSRYEGDVLTVIRQGGYTGPVSEAQLRSTYFLVKGAKITEAERKEKAKARTAPTAQVTPPSPNHPPPEQTPLDDDEKRVARTMFRHAADPEKEYRIYQQKLLKDGGMMKVPVGGGKYE